jgi:hypothetical protein
MNPICRYCGRVSELVGGLVVYPQRSDLAHKWFYLCRPCGAFGGCHPGTQRPLGNLANAELRQARLSAHSHFDSLWKTGRMSRKKAYSWLSDTLGIPPQECHIGMFDVEKCQKTVEACLILRKDFQSFGKSHGVI